MAVVARTRKRDYTLDGQGTLLDQCLAAGLPLASACSGEGACGKCLITILEGAERLVPAEARELGVLAKYGATPDQRLGCQCRISVPEAGFLVTTGYW